MRLQTYFYVFFALILSLTVTNNSQAQTSQLVEEIVVTATKNNTTLQDTPISVSVIQMEDIETLAISDILDLQSSVPSLKIDQTQFAAQNTFLIRGFGNGANNPGIFRLREKNLYVKAGPSQQLHLGRKGFYEVF